MIRGDRLLVPGTERDAFSHSLHSRTREPLLAMSPPEPPGLDLRPSLTLRPSSTQEPTWPS
jgi:hypothetical protein